MWLTRPRGLALRAALAAAISGVVLAGSLAIVLIIAVIGGMVLAAYADTALAFVGIDVPDQWWPIIWVLCAAGGLEWYRRSIAGVVRDERAAVLERTVPASDSEIGDAADLERSIDRLARHADVPPPPVRIHPTSTPVAYTTYRSDDPTLRTGQSEPPVIVLSQGLYEGVSPSERSAVLAHELAHIANGDLRLMTAVRVPLVAADRHTADVGRTANVFELCGLGLAFVASIGIGVFSRGRELAADRAAAALTGDPAALAAALETLDESAPVKPTADLREHARSTNAISILPTLGDDRPDTGLRATHPPLETRLEQLRSMATD